MTTKYWPIHTGMPRNPWQLGSTDGDVYRQPPNGREHVAVTFPTAEAAFRFANRHKLPIVTKEDFA